MNREKRNRQQRWLEISQLLRNQSVVQIAELATRFGVSTETARRDIDGMAEQGLLIRSYGGAAALQTADEPDLAQRTTLLVQERQRIAEEALELVRDGDVLMMDASATCVHFARMLALHRERLTVVTNSFAVANALSTNGGIEILMLPGHFNAHENASFGSQSIQYLFNFQADLCISSCGALTAEGPTEVNSDVASLKRTMIERSRYTALLVDHSKLGPGKLEKVCKLGEIRHIICDTSPHPELASAIHNSGAMLVVAQ
jgi:DeoR/GlpR family transcriptional regulator of sugar metabolism